VVTNVVLGVVILAMLVGFVAFYRYSHTDAFRHGDLRRATFELLVTIGPFFGVHPKRPEPEPSAVLAPKGDTDEDPLQAMGVELHDQRDDDGQEQTPPPVP
jgi:hypothetical protein